MKIHCIELLGLGMILMMGSARGQDLTVTVKLDCQQCLVGRMVEERLEKEAGVKVVQEVFDQEPKFDEWDFGKYGVDLDLMMGSDLTVVIEKWVDKFEVVIKEGEKMLKEWGIETDDWGVMVDQIVDEVKMIVGEQ